MTTREIIALIVGFFVAAIALELLTRAGVMIGIYRYIDLPNPTEFAVGRYIDEIIDEELTAVGIASLGFSVAVGVMAGFATYRKTLNPLKSMEERITAIAWFAALAGILVLTALTQIVFGAHTSGITTLAKDLIEYGGSFFLGWVSWKWWKRKTAVDIDR